MELLPHDLPALGLLVFALGLKHGLDADHLATIDGLTRFNSRAHPGLARYCGMLFSFGHGMVVIGIALFVSVLAHQWQTPKWLETFAAWVSIVFLISLGLANLHAVSHAPAGHVVLPVGLKGRFLGRLTNTTHPVLVILIGVLFALSFDTLSQAAMFSMTAAHVGGWQAALMLGLLFTLGMLVIDGINGFWVSRLIARADRVALTASRVMGLGIAGVSLLAAFFGVMRIALPAIAAWSDGKDVLFGLAVVAIVLGSFGSAIWLVCAPIKYK
ncbi:MAG: HoxN/HupN/NixA family nickel/cobalt transporter [Burkholderiales bacterium]